MFNKKPSPIGELNTANLPQTAQFYKNTLSAMQGGPWTPTLTGVTGTYSMPYNGFYQVLDGMCFFTFFIKSANIISPVTFTTVSSYFTLPVNVPSSFFAQAGVTGNANSSADKTIIIPYQPNASHTYGTVMDTMTVNNGDVIVFNGWYFFGGL